MTQLLYLARPANGLENDAGVLDEMFGAVANSVNDLDGSNFQQPIPTALFAQDGGIQTGSFANLSLPASRFPANWSVVQHATQPVALNVFAQGLTEVPVVSFTSIPTAGGVARFIGWWGMWMQTTGDGGSRQTAVFTWRRDGVIVARTQTVLIPLSTGAFQFPMPTPHLIDIGVPAGTHTWVLSVYTDDPTTSPKPILLTFSSNAGVFGMEMAA